MKPFIGVVGIYLIITSCNQNPKSVQEVQNKSISNSLTIHDTSENIPLKSGNDKIERESDEYKMHLKKLDTIINYKDLFINRDTSWIKRISYRQFLIRYVLQKPTDMVYISDRRLLPKLKYTLCDSAQTRIKDTLKTGEAIEIYLKTKKFNSRKHKIVYYPKGESEYFGTNYIDGQIPWGGEYSLPYFEIETLSIKIDGKQLLIPKSAYQNFYNFKICGIGRWDDRQLEAYTSIDEKFIYIYFNGGNAAGSYITKLVFNKEKYLARMIADHVTQCYMSGFDRYPTGF